MSPVELKTTPRNLFAGMNKTEAAFGQFLESEKRLGYVSEWFYESVTFKLGDDCRYTPDFMVIDPTGLISFHETKGFMRDDALVKLKVCAAQFPFKLVLHVLTKGEWIRTVLQGED